MTTPEFRPIIFSCDLPHSPFQARQPKLFLANRATYLSRHILLRLRRVQNSSLIIGLVGSSLPGIARKDANYVSLDFARFL